MLAVIADEERYGYEIVRLLEDKGLATPEGTIYPLLARLKKEGLVNSRWLQSEQGSPRKYYCLTKEGLTSLGEFKESWLQFSTAVSEILEVVR